MAPRPPTFGAPRRSRGAPLGRALGEMGPRHGPQAPNVRSAPAQPWRSSGPGTGRDGAPTWPPSPQRSERPGAAVALLRAGHWARWGRRHGAPPRPNVRSATAQPWRSSGPGTGRDGGPDMGRPQAPNVRSAPAQPWRLLRAGHWARWGPRHGPKPTTFGAPRSSRGGSSGPGTGRDGGPDIARKPL